MTMTEAQNQNFYSSSGSTEEVALKGRKITGGLERILSSSSPSLATQDEESVFHDSYETTAGSHATQDDPHLHSSRRKSLTFEDSLGSGKMTWGQSSIWSSSVSRAFPEFHPKPRSPSPVAPSLQQYLKDTPPASQAITAAGNLDSYLEVLTRRLHVSNIPFRNREHNLIMFGQFGSVKDAEIIYKSSKCFGFITMTRIQDADVATSKAETL